MAGINDLLNARAHLRAVSRMLEDEETRAFVASMDAPTLRAICERIMGQLAQGLVENATRPPAEAPT